MTVFKRENTPGFVVTAIWIVSLVIALFVVTCGKAEGQEPQLPVDTIWSGEQLLIFMPSGNFDADTSDAGDLLVVLAGVASKQNHPKYIPQVQDSVFAVGLELMAVCGSAGKDSELGLSIIATRYYDMRGNPIKDEDVHGPVLQPGSSSMLAVYLHLCRKAWDKFPEFGRKEIQWPRS